MFINIFCQSSSQKNWTSPIYAFFELTPEFNMFRAKGVIYSSARDGAAKNGLAVPQHKGLNIHKQLEEACQILLG